MFLILSLIIFSQCSIDDDILNLVDDINVAEFVKEASIALEDEEMLREFIKEKATIAVERFLDYLPKMSIPVEKRDLGEGWTLTCRGADGGDLSLTELIIKVRCLSETLSSFCVLVKFI